MKLSYLPSAAATPSSPLRRPLKLSVDPSELLELLSDDESFDSLGVPVDLESRETDRVKAASKSSSKRMHLKIKVNTQNEARREGKPTSTEHLPLKLRVYCRSFFENDYMSLLHIRVPNIEYVPF